MVSSDGLTVADSITGLVWQRDGSGTRTGCSGTGNLTCTWAEAGAYCASLTLGGISGWRLPAVMELGTIADLTKSNPAIDETAFPNTPSEDSFWTSSPSIGSSYYAWYINFFTGYSAFGVTGNTDRVRCVSGSRCYPTSRFVVLQGGLVRDTLTKLVWQQQVSTATMTWAAGQTYCSNTGSGFRTPTVKELESIADLTVPDPGPAIDQTAFPNTPAIDFWTSLPLAGSSGFAWSVYFRNGSATPGDMGWDSKIRCVR